LTTFLGAHSRIGAGRIDERDHRRAELGGKLHEPEGLPVAFGMRHAEVARDILPCVPSFLMSDHHDWLALEARKAPDDRLIVAEHAIAVQLDEVLEQQLVEIERMGSLGVSRDLGTLPGGQVTVDLLLELAEPSLEPCDLRASSRRLVTRTQGQDAVLELEERLLEVKLVLHTR